MLARAVPRMPFRLSVGGRLALPLVPDCTLRCTCCSYLPPPNCFYACIRPSSGHFAILAALTGGWSTNLPPCQAALMSSRPLSLCRPDQPKPAVIARLPRREMSLRVRCASTVCALFILLTACGNSLSELLYAHVHCHRLCNPPSY